MIEFQILPNYFILFLLKNILNNITDSITMSTAPESMQKVFNYIDKNVDKTMPFPIIQLPNKKKISLPSSTELIFF